MSGEISKILLAIEKADSRYRHLKDMTIKALNTAMRQGEILSMEKNELTFTNGIISEYKKRLECHFEEGRAKREARC